jgi:pimeloyl-ACP methyl ester carboxylesterase
MTTIDDISRRVAHVVLACAIAFASLGAAATPAAQAQANCEPDGQQASGAVYRICIPPAGAWNGDLVVYAHGYVAFNKPIAIPEDQLSIPGNPSIPDIVTGLGYAFATTSYSVNGLAVKEGMSDLLNVVSIFSATHGQPNRIYLVGPSEGGLITTLSVEQHPDVYDGGMAACGPIGDFRRQINYWGDGRVLFDYFFPGVISGSPVHIPQEVIDTWESVYIPRVENALHADPQALAQLLVTARIPADPSDPDAGIKAVVDLLWYNVFATNDGIAKLGGQPYDNHRRIYIGSGNDLRLNRMVARFQADSATLVEINAQYQTSGNLSTPLVTTHTLADHIVPYWHEPLYTQKIIANGDWALRTNLPSPHFGHCTFTVPELLVTFGILVFQVTGGELQGVDRVLPDAQARVEYQALLRAHQADLRR